MKTNKKTTRFEDHLEQQYGKVGTEKRTEFESEFESFKVGALIRDARKKANMTQEELAQRIATKRSYISRVEHDASDIRLSSLARIAAGLGGRLKLNIVTT